MKLRPTMLHAVCCLYRIMLYAYPPAFRIRYGQEMAQAFREDMRQSLSTAGPLGLVRFWIRIATDLAAGAAREQIASPGAIGLICFPAAVAIGLCAAYVDRHNATEVYPTLSVVLAGSFLLGLIRPTHPWRWAMIIAPWIAFYGPLMTLTHQLRSPGAWAILGIVSIPGLIGAFTGSTLRRAVGTTR